MDEMKGVVCDIGSKVSKVGFASEEQPRKVFPSAVGRFRHSGLLDAVPDIYCGQEAVKNQGFSKLSWPVQEGMVNNWNDLEKLWHHMFYTSLYVPPETTRTMCIVHPLTSNKDKMKMAEIMFEAFTVPALYLGSAPAMVLYASGRTTGVVWDCGASCCLTTAVYEGFPLTFTTTSSPLTGDMVTKTLLKMLSDIGYSFTTPTEIRIIEDLKANECFVVTDYEKEVKYATNNDSQYTLPDGQKIMIGDLKFRAPEIFFQPSLGGLNCPNIISNIFKCINKVDFDVRSQMYGNVVLAGGSSLFRDLEVRIASEMKGKLERMRGGGEHVEPQVDAMPAREIAAWAGGSIIASMDNLNGLWMTAAEYDDSGAGVVNEKFF